MTKEDIKTFLMIITTLIVPILSLGIISPLIKIFFILIYICICFLVLSELFADKLKIKNIVIIIATVVEILFIVISSLNIGSVNGFFERIRSFFVVSQEITNDTGISSDVNIESHFDSLSEQILEINKKIEYNNSNIEKMNADLNILTNNLENVHFNENIDEIEINKIIELIKKYYEEQIDSFENLRTDRYLLELFYKMYITNEAYYYCNIIKAFEDFGINIEKMKINENTLLTWDVEILFSTYNMYKQNYNNICLDENTREVTFLYNENRIVMQKYSDTFDYGNWQRNYTGYEAKEIEIKLYNIIMGYYKKFIINFSVE